MERDWVSFAFLAQIIIGADHALSQGLQQITATGMMGDTPYNEFR